MPPAKRYGLTAREPNLAAVGAHSNLVRGNPNRKEYRMPVTYLNTQAIGNPSLQTEIDVANGAISISHGTVVLQSTSVLAMTLAASQSGANAGYVSGSLLVQKDGEELLIVDAGGAAHTITTPSNVINGNKHIATFGGTVGSFLRLVAIAGIYYVTGNSGVTLT
jgi:hypothetical protein